MENLRNVDTQKNVSNNDLLVKFGLSFGDKTKSPKKTNKQKLIDSIEKEISVISERENLELLTVGEDNNRKELRFHNKPKENNTIEFNVKYKSKIVYLGNYEVLKCENDIETYVSNLEKCIEVVKGLNESDELFKQLS